MLLFLMMVVLLVVGIVLAVKNNPNCGSFGWFIIGLITACISGVVLFVCIISLIFLPAHVRSNIILYGQDKQIYESAISNKNITTEERASTIKLVKLNNVEILNNKLYCNSKFVGWYYSKKIAELELFDISKIPSVVNKNEYIHVQ